MGKTVGTLGAPTSEFHLSATGGVVTDWRERNKYIFFPQTMLNIDGKKKLRGGMHPCFPNFGTVGERYGLPQHGPLRDATGTIERSAGNPWANTCRFVDRRDLLGNFKKPCTARISTERLSYGFFYRLEVELSSAATESVPVSAGLHPYFATPQGAAWVIADKPHKIEGLLTDAIVMPLSPVVHIDIPGVGTVQMVMDGELRTRAISSNPSARLVLWRDKTDYLCVEPVLAMGKDFDTPMCPRLEPGDRLTIACAFRLL